jgi:hypothetical protein
MLMVAGSSNKSQPTTSAVQCQPSRCFSELETVVHNSMYRGEDGTIFVQEVVPRGCEVGGYWVDLGGSKRRYQSDAALLKYPGGVGQIRSMLSYLGLKSQRIGIGLWRLWVRTLWRFHSERRCCAKSSESSHLIQREFWQIILIAFSYFLSV